MLTRDNNYLYVQLSCLLGSANISHFEASVGLVRRLHNLVNTELTSLTHKEVCCLGNIGRMVGIVVWIPKLAVTLVNTISKIHQYIGGYLNIRMVPLIAGANMSQSDIMSKHILP